VPARRAAPPRERTRLVGLTGLIVVGLALGLGFLAGRYWDRVPSLRRATAVAGLEARRPAASPRESERPARPPEPAPKLTFYHELTKPLPTPAAPPRRERPPRAERESPRTDPPSARAEAQPADGGFTVQVAAYRTRAQAESLRASLADGGHDAYIVEAEAAGGVTYRVRVGTYASREAARAAAQAIGGERQLHVYVTAR
jgi:rare lipoprotein A